MFHLSSIYASTFFFSFVYWYKTWSSVRWISILIGLSKILCDQLIAMNNKSFAVLNLSIKYAMLFYADPEARAVNIGNTCKSAMTVFA